MSSGSGDDLRFREVVSLGSLWFLDCLVAMFLWHAFRFTLLGSFLPWFYITIALPVSFALVRSRFG